MHECRGSFLTNRRSEMRLHAASLCGSHLTEEALWDQDWAAVVFPVFSWNRGSCLVQIALVQSGLFKHRSGPNVDRSELVLGWRPVKTGLGTNQFKCLCTSFFGRARMPHSGSYPDWPSCSTTFQLRFYRGSPSLLSQPSAARVPGGTGTVRDQNISLCMCGVVAFRWFCWGNRMEIADCLC